jgi:tRNA (adenine37-N6)-methyltransferase
MQSTTLICDPIGYFYCSQKERYSVPKQPSLGENNGGVIKLNPHQNFEQALEDLSGFNRLWVIFWFHRNIHWKPKVLTPHGYPKRGLFATRSPHRPNPIGLSCLEIMDIKGLNIYVSSHDLVDKTPILDIKPYVAYADAWPESHQGWLEKYQVTENCEIQWSDVTLQQLEYLEAFWNLKMKDELDFRLKTQSAPSANNRVVPMDEGLFSLAYKTWRIIFKKDESSIEVLKIRSGYDAETLLGNKTSRWEDVHIHRAFFAKFTD